MDEEQADKWSKSFETFLTRLGTAAEFSVQGQTDESFRETGRAIRLLAPHMAAGARALMKEDVSEACWVNAMATISRNLMKEYEKVTGQAPDETEYKVTDIQH